MGNIFPYSLLRTSEKGNPDWLRGLKTRIYFYGFRALRPSFPGYLRPHPKLLLRVYWAAVEKPNLSCHIMGGHTVAGTSTNKSWVAVKELKVN